jgi:hypothetical protein
MAAGTIEDMVETDHVAGVDVVAAAPFAAGNVIGTHP